MTVKKLDDLAQAKQGSYYTLLGCGGDLQEWITGYEDLLEQAEIGKPTTWFRTTGGDVNEFARAKKAGQIHRDDCFEPDLVILMFPLDGLHIGKLAMFKLQYQDRWFDDVIANMRVVA